MLSNSWGAESPNEPLALREEIEACAEAGALFVAAAGNGEEDCLSSNYRKGYDLEKRPSWPASHKLPLMLTVGAVDKKDRRAAFSNWWAHGAGGTERGVKRNGACVWAEGWR